MAQKIIGLNGVRLTLSASINTTDTSIVLNTAISPYQEPPDPGTDFYYLTLADFTNRPENWERVKVTARSGAGPYTLTVERNIDSSTGSGIAFASGSAIQWVPGVEEFESKVAFTLSAGGYSTSIFKLSPTSASAQYTVPASFYDNAVRNNDIPIRWYNNTGKTLKISQLLVYSSDFNHVGDITLTVQINGVDSAINVTVLSADTSPVLKRDSVNVASLADGSYLAIKCTNTAASETGRLYLHRIQLLVSE